MLTQELLRKPFAMFIHPDTKRLLQPWFKGDKLSLKLSVDLGIITLFCFLQACRLQEL